MRGVNIVTVGGNLGRDPEVKYLPSGIEVASFSLALTEKWKDNAGATKEKTTWVNIVCYAALAETVAKYVGKGDEILVIGKINVREWEDREGTKKKAWEIVAKDVHFIKTKRREEGPGNDREPPPNGDDDVPF